MMVNWYWTKCPIPVELTTVAWGGGGGGGGGLLGGLLLPTDGMLMKYLAQVQQDN